MSEQSTFLVPTRNRPYFLKRMLDYHALMRSPYLFFIGDASDAENHQRVKDLIKTYPSLRIDLIYFPSNPLYDGPGEGVIECQNYLLKEVKSPYVVCHADDDFIVPKAVDRCIAFLDTHHDYSVAHGEGLVSMTESNGPHYLVTEIFPCLSGGNEQDQPSERYLQNVRELFMAGESSKQFTVKRAHQMRANWKIAFELRMDNFFEEFLNNSLSALQGKIKKLDGLYIIRQQHGGMVSQRRQSVFDWILDPRFLEKTQNFIHVLSDVLAQEGRMERKAAEDIIRRGFYSYLLDFSKVDWVRLYGQKISTRHQMRTQIKNIPAFRNLWIFARSFFPRGKKSLSALLRPSSPFFEDFMPIYHSLTGNLNNA